MEAVKEFAKSEIPAARAAVSEMASNPRDIPGKLIEFFKGLWSRIQEAGILDIIVTKAKELLAVFTGAANSAASTAGEALPLIQNANDQVATAAVKAGEKLSEAGSSAKAALTHVKTDA